MCIPARLRAVWCRGRGPPWLEHIDSNYLEATVVRADGEDALPKSETHGEDVGGPRDRVVDGVVDGVDARGVAGLLAQPQHTHSGAGNLLEGGVAGDESEKGPTTHRRNNRKNDCC